MFETVVNLLLPRCKTSAERDALLMMTFSSEPEIVAKINYEGSAQVFVPRLIRMLQAHGQTSSQREALWQLLETLYDQVGDTGQQTIQSLEGWANRPHQVAFQPAETLIQHQRRARFMVEALPDDFVPRPQEFEPIVASLVSQGQGPVAITAALKGAGGYGKTTLARAVCHDKRVQKTFKDGVLWVTLGEKITKNELLDKVLNLMVLLNNERPALTDLEIAKSRFKEVVGDAHLLIVVDDVWESHHAQPFLNVGPNVTVLITTRSSGVLPRNAIPYNVDAMHTDEARDLLSTWLAEAPSYTVRLADLAQRLGEWPLLLKLANGQLRKRVSKQQTLVQALDWLDEAFKRKGFAAFDDPNSPEKRNQAAAASISVSLDLLDVTQRRQFGQLAIFPEDQDIPFAALAHLWAMDVFGVEELGEYCADLSLLLRFDLTVKAIRLHDVVRTFLREQHSADLARWHAEFLAAYRVETWHTLPANEPYLWAWLAYHLIESGQQDILRGLLLDPRYLRAKLNATNANVLIADADLYLASLLSASKDERDAVRLIRSVLSLSAHVLAQNKGVLGSQLVGRLMRHRTANEEIRLFTDYIMETVSGLYPAFPSSDYAVLNPAGSALLRTLKGHKDWVNHVVLTPDGRTAVSASGDSTLIVWDIITGQAIHTLKGHTDWVNHVVLTPDGRTAVSASYDNTLIVWDIVSGQAIHTLRGHTYRVNHVALASDGRTAVSASSDSTLIVWDIATGQLIRTLRGHTYWVNHVALASDGRTAVSASLNNTLIVWDIVSGQAIRILSGHRTGVMHVVLTPDGRTAVSASFDKTLIVWDIATGQPIHTLTGHKDWVRHVVLTPDGRTAVSASDDKMVRGWDIATGQPIHTLTGHTNWVNHVVLTPDGRTAISASLNNTLRGWDIATGQSTHTFTGHTRAVNHVVLTPDGRTAVSASYDNTLIVWDIALEQAPHIVTGHSDWVNHVVLTPDGRTAISASSNNTLIVWDIATGQPIHTLTGHTERVTYVVLTLDGHTALSTSFDKTLIVWDIATGQAIHTLTGHTNWVTHVVLTLDGRTAVSASYDKTLIVWDIATGQAIHTLTGHTDWVRHIVLTPDGRTAVSVSDDKTVRVWNIAPGQPIHTLTEHTNWVRHVVLTPDGRTAVSASYDKTLIVWDIASGQAIHTLTGHTDSVYHVGLAPDGRTAVSTSDDGTLIVWNIVTGQRLLQVNDTVEGRQQIAYAYPHIQRVDGFRRHADGQRLFYRGATLLWQAPSGAMARFVGDAPITSAEIGDEGIVMAGDVVGRVLFLRCDESKLNS